MDAGAWVAVPSNLRCRLLFGSPVCALVTHNAPGDAGSHPINVMTISWLTPIENMHSFVVSINTRRFTLENVLRDGAFTLSVAVAGMESALLEFGSMTGHARCLLPSEVASSQDCKYTRYIASAPWVLPGTSIPWTALSDGGGRGQLPAHGASPAHLVCRVVTVLSPAASVEEPPPSTLLADSRALHGAGVASGSGCGMREGEGGGAASTRGKRQRALTHAERGSGHRTGPNHQHALLLCSIEGAWVRQSYWHSGKIFGALAPLPPLLAFAGTKRFAHIVLAPSSLSAGSCDASQAVTSEPTLRHMRDDEPEPETAAARDASASAGVPEACPQAGDSRDSEADFELGAAAMTRS
jgi:flavin reductase (DIM6/NTAB) family NADH-FMN oxidoreductase RutF